MELRKICDDTKDMGMWELAHNMAFVKNGEAWYRDFERELPVRDLVREIYRKHAEKESLTEGAEEPDNETLDEILMDNLQYGTDNWDGIIGLLYISLWGAAELREWLKTYETTGLPTTAQPEVLKQAIEAYGSYAQVDVAIEEMSELTKALLKLRRAGSAGWADAKESVFEEMADVVIMLTQLMMIYGGRKAVQQFIDAKVKRLAGRLSEAAPGAGANAAQEVLQPAT